MKNQCLLLIVLTSVVTHVSAEEFNAVYYPNGLLTMRVINRTANDTIVGLAQISLIDNARIPYIMIGAALENPAFTLDLGPIERRGIAKLSLDPLIYSPRSTILQSEGDVRLDSVLGGHTTHGVVVTTHTPVVFQLGAIIDTTMQAEPFVALSYPLNAEWYFETRTRFRVPQPQYDHNWFADYPYYPGRELFHSSLYAEYATARLKSHLTLHLSYGPRVPLRPGLTFLVHGTQDWIGGGLVVGAVFPDYFNGAGAIIEEWGQIGGWLDIDLNSYLTLKFTLNNVLYLPYVEGHALHWHLSPLKLESNTMLIFTLPIDKVIEESIGANQNKSDTTLESQLELSYRYDNRDDASARHRIRLSPLVRANILPLVIEASYRAEFLADIFPTHTALLTAALNGDTIEGSLALRMEFEDLHGNRKIDGECTARIALLPSWGKLILQYQLPITTLPTWDNSELTVSFTLEP